MATDIKVPEVGESITEGVLVRWLKEDGDSVQESDPLFELETDKASTEVPSPADGILRIEVEEGETVEVGAVVGKLEASKGQENKAEKEKEAAESDEDDEEGQKTDSQSKAKGELSSKKQKRAAESDEDDDEPAMSPAARRLIDEEELDVAKIEGTGRRGLITKQDVSNYLESRDDKDEQSKEKAKKPIEKAEKPKDDDEVKEKTEQERAGAIDEERREQLSPIRQRIAARLVRSQRETASLTTVNEADMSAVLSWRNRHKDAFEKKHHVSLGFMSFFVKASVRALQDHPIVNARIDDKDIVYPGRVNIGVAVSTDQGLMVPVLRDADRMSFADIERMLADVVQKARDGKITVQDLQGGTFTITNGGVFGSLLSTPVLNPPQSAILGMHTIQKRPVVRDDEMVIRPMMYLALTYDHRLIDGRDAVLFLRSIKECIEEPERMFLGV